MLSKAEEKELQDIRDKLEALTDEDWIAHLRHHRKFGIPLKPRDLLKVVRNLNAARRLTRRMDRLEAIVAEKERPDET